MRRSGIVTTICALIKAYLASNDKARHAVPVRGLGERNTAHVFGFLLANYVTMAIIRVLLFRATCRLEVIAHVIAVYAPCVPALPAIAPNPE